jgi:hypothetical protein
MYLLAAVAVYKIETFVRTRKEALHAIVLGSMLGGVFLLSNIDILGYPQIYYLFFFPGYVDITKLTACWGW